MGVRLNVVMTGEGVPLKATLSDPLASLVHSSSGCTLATFRYLAASSTRQIWLGRSALLIVLVNIRES
ncbi:protein of unknown function (plasmid) [Caballeronia sp. S22]